MSTVQTNNIVDVLGIGKPTLNGENVVTEEATQTIAGQKTFSTPVKLADAVNYDEAVSKNQLDTKPTGFKNLIINANGLINQRGYVSGTATTVNNEYTLDRWRVITSGEALTFSTTDNITTFTAPLNGVEQIVEDINVISGNYTLSFTGTATATISQSSDNVTYTAVTANADGSYTIVGMLYTKVNLAGGTFSLVQLEEGSVATPFEQRPYGLELSLCQRYYKEDSFICVRVNDNSSFVGQSIQSISFALMRSKPTFTFTLLSDVFGDGQNTSGLSDNLGTDLVPHNDNLSAVGHYTEHLVKMDAEL